MGFSVVIPTSATLNASVEGEAVLAAITGANATLTAAVAVPGPQGPQGPQGEPGQGVPSGGSTGQFLTKTSGADYATGWTTLSLAGYATESWVTAGFYPLTGNPSGFLTSSALTGYATQSWVTSQGYLTSSALTPYLQKAGGIITGDILSYNGSRFTTIASGSGSTYCQISPDGVVVSGGTGGITIQWDGITFPGGGISKQTVAYPGMAAFEALFYPLYSNPAGYLTDAPSDGSQYARQDGAWSVVSAGGSYLPLAGGALDSNASITASDTGTTTDSELAGWGLGVQLSADHTKGTTVEFDGLDTYDGSSHMQVTPTGLTFPDASVQTFAFPGFNGYATESWVSSNYVLKSGGELTGSIYFTNPNPVSLETSDLGWNGLTVYSDLDPAVEPMRVTSSGLQFPDNTTQTTGFPGFAGYATESWVYGRGYITSASVASTYAPLASPALTGTPTAPTASTGTSSTQIATTAFVQSAIIAGSAHAETLQATVRNNTGATLSPFTVVYINGALGNNATVAKAQANSEATSSGTFAVTQAAISNNADGIVISAGVLSNVDTSAYTDGDKLYLSPTTAGAVTTTKPSAPNHLVYVGVVTRSHPTQGTVSVRIQNGYELDELHDVAIASKTNLDLLSYESSTDLWKNKSFATLGLAGLASPTFTGTPLSTTAAVDTNTTQIATTAYVVGQGYLKSATANTTYAPLASPSLTGTPLSTTAAADTNTTQIATTAYVVGQGYAKLASPTFTGTPTLPTGTTATTQTAGDNSTKLATTAFVTAADNLKANLASPTFTGTPTAPIPGISTRSSQLSTRSDTWASILCPGLRITTLDYMQSAVTGTGSLYSNFQPSSGRLRGPNASTAGSALLRSNNSAQNGNNNSLFSRGLNQGSINWTKPVAFSIRCMLDVMSSGTVFRVTVGKITGAGTGDLATQGIGVTQTGTGALVLQSHNGTTLTNTTSSFTPSAGVTYDLEVYSDGAGNAYLYINDAQVATNSGAPTTASTANGGQYMIEVVSDGTQTSQAAYFFSTQKIFYGV